MKNTSILIPVILIGCLAALIYLFFAALQAAEGEDPSGTDRIVLNPADYSDEESPTDLGQDADFEPYFAEVPEDEKIGSDQENTSSTTGNYNSGNQSSGSTASAASGPTGSSTGSSSSSTSVASEGRYLVIAGSFRQLENGKEQVKALKAAGFGDTRLEKFNRGTFAVALAGQSNRYSEANRLAEKVKAAGFEAKVMRRR